MKRLGQIKHSCLRFTCTSKLYQIRLFFCFFPLKSITLLHDDDVEQSSSQSEEDLSFNKSTSAELANYRSQETQTKLFAILLPESPLSEMKSAKIEASTSRSVTRLCQVNTLSYLIKSNESETNVSQMDGSSSVSFLHTDSQLVGEFSTDGKSSPSQTVEKHSVLSFNRS